MGKQGERTTSNHNNLRTVARAGAGAGIVGLGAAAAYYAYRHRKNKNQTIDPDKQQQSTDSMTALFSEPRLKRPELVAEVAFRAYYANGETAAVIMPSTLREQVGRHIGRHAFQDAVGHLRDRGFIRTVPLGGRGRRGYQATEELVAVFDRIEDYPQLADAQNRVLGLAFDAAQYDEQVFDED